MNNLWLIGDIFLNEIFHALPQIKNEARSAKSGEIPYIYDYYNISCFTPNPQTLVKNVLARMVNCFIKALNDTVVLPRMVIFLPDWDLIRFMKKGVTDEEEVQEKMRKGTKWVVTQVIRVLEIKKDDMKIKKPGAVASSEPKVLWIKMFNRVNGNGHGSTLSWKAFYNNILEDSLTGKQNMFIGDVNKAMMDASLFDRNNRLNGFGRVRFWSEIDKLVERFDKKVFSLKPVSSTVASGQSSSQGRGCLFHTMRDLSAGDAHFCFGAKYADKKKFNQ